MKAAAARKTRAGWKAIEEFGLRVDPAAGRVARIAGVSILVSADLAALALCHFAAHQVRAGLLARYSFFQLRGETIGYEAYLFFISIYLVVFASAGLYTRRMGAVQDSALVLRACFYSTACALTLASVAHVAELYSRAVIAMSAALAACALPVTRLAVKRMLGKWRAWLQPVVLIGWNGNGLRAAEDIRADPTTGYRVAGILTETAPDCEGPWPVEIVPDRGQAIQLCRRWGVRSVVLCATEGDADGLERSLELLEKFAVDIKIASASEELHSLRLESELLRSTYLLSYANPLEHPANRALKRLLDVAGALALGVLFLPVLAAAPLVVRLSSPGPVFYRSARIGRRGRRFWCWKFRTMYADADQRLERILAQDAAAAEEFAARYKLREDPRITPAGAWLRRTSLDELPQLWNVLRGEMSLVGPRPILPGELERFDPELANYFRVPSGLTGLWQISGRSDLSYAERIRLDQFYVRNWSVWLDLVILARTAACVFRGSGAY